MPSTSDHLFRAELYHDEGGQAVVETIRDIRAPGPGEAIFRAVEWAQSERDDLHRARSLRVLDEAERVIWDRDVADVF